MIEYANYFSLKIGDAYLYECQICRALVVTPQLHNKWHKIEEKVA